VSNLSRDQVRAIFSGETTDWAAVGGEPGRIFVAMRNANSAIRLNFEAYFFATKPTYAKGMFEVNDINQTISSLTGRSDVISIITINDQSLNESRIKLLSIDGVAPTKQNLQSGVYPVRRPLYLVYNPKTVKPAVLAFLDFTLSPAGQRIIAEKGSG
jgi:phosphate transport system substrate-binding protein